MTNKPTIFHIITDLHEGGAEGVLYRICEFDTSSTHVVVSLSVGGKYALMLKGLGIEVIELQLNNPFLFISSFVKIFRLIRIYKPQVVQTWMYHSDFFGGVAARLAGARSVCWGIRHSNLTFGTVKAKTILIAKICALLSYFVPDQIISCSEQGMYSHIKFGYCSKKFVVIQNGFNVDKFVPNKSQRIMLRRSILGDYNGIVFGMVARFDAQKDHENLFRALHMLKVSGFCFRCILVGNGIDNTNLQLDKYLSKYGIQDYIVLLGRRSDIPAIMNAIDVHVLSSLGEAFPNVLAEAMACGIPCITTDVGDAAQIVGNTGWVIPSKNPQKLFEAFVDVIHAFKADSSWLDRKREARLRIIQKFSMNSMVAEYIKSWTKVNSSDA